MVLAVRVAVTVAPVVVFNPVEGAQLYVLAPLAVSEAEPPLHMVADDGVIVNVGKGFTVTITVCVFTHPLELVPVTVYVFVEVGFAVTVAPVVTLNPVEGAQVYVLAPLAVNDVELPVHIVADDGVTVKVGNAFVPIVTVAVITQLL